MILVLRDEFHPIDLLWQKTAEKHAVKKVLTDSKLTDPSLKEICITRHFFYFLSMASLCKHWNIFDKVVTIC